MKPSDPRSWSITVRARSNGVDLRLRATNILPGHGGGGGGGGGAALCLRLSLRLRLRLRRMFLSLVLRLRTVEPQNGGANIHNARPKSRLLGFLGKLFGRRGGFLRRRRSIAPLGKRSRDRSVGSVCVEWIGAARQLRQDVFSRYTPILENRRTMWLIIIVLLSVLIFKLGNLNSKNSMGVQLTSLYLRRREAGDSLGPFLYEQIRKMKLMIYCRDLSTFMQVVTT